MLIIYILLSLLILVLSAHLLVLPLSKKRPIFIKGFEGSFFLLILVGVIAFFIHPALYLLAIIMGALIYFTKSWLVYGVSSENIDSALGRAILASRATSTKVKNGYEIDNSMSVKITNLGMRICYIQYRNKSFSKKSELTKEIFRKFVQNYYI